MTDQDLLQPAFTEWFKRRIDMKGGFEQSELQAFGTWYAGNVKPDEDKNREKAIRAWVWLGWISRAAAAAADQDILRHRLIKLEADLRRARRIR